MVLGCFMLSSGNLSAQIYVNEDFSTFTDSILPPVPSGWKNEDSLSPPAGQIWRFDNPNPRTLQAPIDSNFAILDSDWYGIGANQDAYLVSPTFDASLATVVTLTFDHSRIGLGGDTSSVEVFDGSNWVEVANYHGQSFGSFPFPPNPLTRTESINISAQAAGISNAQVRFLYKGNWDYWWAIDNVSIFQPVPDDLATISVDSLASGCSLDSVQVYATVVNVGSTTINSFNMNYTVNGSGLVAEAANDTLAPGDTVSFMFSQLAPVGTAGNYDIDVYTFLRNDVNNVNDTATGIVQNLAVNNTFPYTEGFESGNGGWIAGGANSSWQLGAPSNTIINSAAGGTQAYVTNLTGDYNNSEQSFILSPCFDFTTLTQPQIKFDIWVETENFFDGAVIQSSIDGGATWSTIGGLNDGINWYNLSAFAITNFTGDTAAWNGSSPFTTPAGWALAERDLPTLAGQPSVRFRILFASDGSAIEEGIGIDNILIQEAPAIDAGIVELVRPSTNCQLGAADSVEVRIINQSAAAISGFGVSYELNGAAAVNETFTASINPGDTSNYVFTSTVNLSALGTYNLKTYTSLTGDGNATNDTLNSIIDNLLLVNTFPYAEGFESGNGGWVSGGSSSSWQVGTPSAPIINAAATGTGAYSTNLSGVYNNNEESFIESPCFDFTGITLPQIYMNIWVESESFYDGTILQSSIDGGASWQTVGALNDPINWYNGNANALFGPIGSGECWTGASPFSPTPGWVVASRSLSGLGGQPSVRLRFFFASDGSAQREGFAVDDIVIDEAPASDVAVLEVIAPSSSCGLSASDTVSVLLTNVGSGVLDTIPVTYTVNGVSPYTDTIFAIVNPGDTIVFTFDTSYDFSAAGTYRIFAQSSVSGDPNLFNDSASLDVQNTINTLVTLPYNENFDGPGFISGAGGNNAGSAFGNGWFTIPDVPEFAWGVRNIPTASGGTGPDTDHSSTGNFIYVESSNGGIDDVAELHSPCIDLTGTIAPQMEFWYHKFGGNMPTLFVDVFDGNDWIEVDTILGQTHASNTGAYMRRNVSLLPYAGSVIQVRFRSGGKNDFSNDMAIDDFSVFEPSSTDAGISAITGLSGGCGLSAADSVTVTIVNAGSNPIDTVPVGYTVNFGGLVLDTSFVTIPPSGSVNFTFATTVNLSTAGNYFIDAFTLLVGDGNSSNDTASSTIVSEPTLAYPYSEDFETSNGGWTASGTNASWAWGAPTAPYISNAGNGTNAWVTNLAGPYSNNEDSYLESPCIDLTALTADPRLEFLHSYLTEECCDEGWVELSTDGGQNYSKILTSTTAINWYNDSTPQLWNDSSVAGSGNWQVASTDLTGAAGNIVKVRFAFSSDFSVTADGFGVDSVSIDLSIGIEDTKQSEKVLSIFPNPSKGQFILRAELGESYDITILSASGRMVYDQRISFNTSRDRMIDLSAQAKGLYFIRLQNEQEMITKKVIIQ